MLIRDRRPSDGPPLEAIAIETHRLDGYPKYLPGDLRSFIVDPEALGAWVAVDGADVIGHVALHHRTVPEVMDVIAGTGLEEDGVAVVARLLVTPAARRRGIGRTLLEKATAEAYDRGRRAALDVVEEHTAAIRLYEHCGWTRIGRVDWELPGGLPLREFVYLSPRLPSDR